MENDLKRQLEYVRDVRKNALAVVITRGNDEKVVKTFPRTKLADAERYAIRMRPSRITDVRRGMEVVGVYPEYSITCVVRGCGMYANDFSDYCASHG